MIVGVRKKVKKRALERAFHMVSKGNQGMFKGALWYGTYWQELHHCHHHYHRYHFE